MQLADYANAALGSWIKTFPIEENLATFLKSLPLEIQSLVEKKARAAFAAADRLLDEAAKTGEVDIALFQQEMSTELRRRFDWIDESGLSSLRSYVGWFAWHEGYLKR